MLAARALSQALLAGDRALALAAARALEKSGNLAPDARLLLLVEAVRESQWGDARRQVDRIEKDEVFSFMAPLLRAWIAVGARRGDPIEALATLPADGLAALYAAEQRPLLLLAQGKSKSGLSALSTVLADSGPREAQLRFAAAALIAGKDREAALLALEGEAPALAAARERLATRRRLESDGAARLGLAEFLLRIANDLNAQDLPELALSFARLATFLAPSSAPAWLTASELLAKEGRDAAALAALDKVAADDPWAGPAAEQRIALLADSGREQEALAAARAAAEAEPGEVQGWVRVGDLLTDMARHVDAAEAYSRALTLARDGAPTRLPLWALWLFRGSALTQAGDWPEAKAALEEAYKLAPGQAVVLNYLGYSQLERRENLAEAERLIREASRLQPNDAAITDSLGWAHYVRGDVARAIELLERAARGQPADAAINEHLGDAYYSAGRRFEARYAWRAALVYAEGAAAERLRAKIDSGLRPELAAP